MKLLSLLALTSTALSAAAQTAPAAHTSTVHHPVAAHSTAFGGCLPTPSVSAKIPALPASASCAKSLYTITRVPDTHVDYISPLVGPEVRANLEIQKETFSLLYSDVKVGTGEPVRSGTFLSVKYTGWLVDGTKFDSSYDHPGAEPLSFPHGQHRVIAGWDTGFEGMHVGGKRRLYIPYQLAYGPAGQRSIPPKAELVFDIELVGQSDKEPAPPTPAVPPAAARPATPPPATTQTPPPATTTPKP